MTMFSRKKPAVSAGSRVPIRSLATGLVIVAVASPLVFGATPVWAYCSLQMVVAVAALVWCAARPAAWGALWLVVATAALGILQVVPVSPTVIGALSPLKQKAAAEVRELTDRTPGGGVSVNTAETLGALRRCLMLALVVLIVADLARETRTRQILIWSVAGVGGLVLLLGLTVGEGPDRKVLGIYNRDGYWKFYKNPLLSPYDSSGMGYADPVQVGPITYMTSSRVCGTALGALVNANHFAACVGLTAPLVIGLSLARGRQSRKLGWIWTAGGVAYGLLAAYAIAVPAHARGGIAAFVLAGLLVASLAWARTRTRVIVLLVILLSGFAACFAVAIQLRIWTRLEGRESAWKAAFEMFQQAPWLGIGLGNYGNTYPAFQSGTLSYLAHNAWIETAAEGGSAGLVLLASGCGWIAWQAGRLWTWPTDFARRSVRFGLVGSLLFAALHAGIDWGIQVPANACLCAVLIGLLLGDVHADQCHQPVRFRPAFSALPVMGTVATLAVCGFLIYGSKQEMRVDRLVMPLRAAIARQRVPSKERVLDPKPELLQQALPDAERAYVIAPRNAACADAIGQAFLHLSNGEPGPELSAADAWFSRSLLLAPVNPWTKNTLREIRRQSGERK